MEFLDKAIAELLSRLSEQSKNRGIPERTMKHRLRGHGYRLGALVKHHARLIGVHRRRVVETVNLIVGMMKSLRPTTRPSSWSRVDYHGFPGARGEAPHKDKQLHIRIEDTLLITEEGPEVLSSHVPKEVDEILALVGSRTGATTNDTSSERN